MKTLTKAEEQVMHVLWNLGKALVHDILDKLPEPRPAYNTVSTVVRVLEKKGFVDHKAYGNTYEYFPLISKEEYTKFHFGEFLEKYFNNSFSQLASFFTRENKLTMRELEELMKEVRKEIKDKEEEV
ncbi:MAG: BlaI/MecI/CopY family transcriptional regulator [Chlorobi bacterium]|nr:BlaI/MecI/CopY family transcriptional regulator [Chlorobiota bacterium]